MNIFKYIRDAIKELSFVTWPKKDVLIRHSLIVLCVTIVFAAAFWLLDGGLRAMVARYISSTESFRGTGSVMTQSGATLPTDIPLDLNNIQINGGAAGTQATPIQIQ